MGYEQIRDSEKQFEEKGAGKECQNKKETKHKVDEGETRIERVENTKRNGGIKTEGMEPSNQLKNSIQVILGYR
jgi:hypothetical protein